jgi:hypothetical protein
LENIEVLLSLIPTITLPAAAAGAAASAHMQASAVNNFVSL